MVSDPILVGMAYGFNFLFSFGVAFGIAKSTISGRWSIQRAIGIFGLAFVAGSLTGIATSMALYVVVGPQMQYESSSQSLLLPLWGKCIALSAFGAWDAIRRERKKLRELNSHQNSASVSTSNKSNAPNDAYAAAFAEIEEGRLDKGIWARAFAESGGDESKAKALYIKARAESIGNEAVWVDTQPPIADDAGNTDFSHQLESVSAPKSEDEQMKEFGITFDGDRYSFGEYRYERLTDALNYARAQRPSAPFWGKKPVPSAVNSSRLPANHSKQMADYGIEFDGTYFIYQQYKYENLVDAIEYARKSGPTSCNKDQKHAQNQSESQNLLKLAQQQALHAGLTVQDVEYLGRPIKAVKYLDKYGVSKDQLALACTEQRIRWCKTDILWVSDEPITKTDWLCYAKRKLEL